MFAQQTRVSPNHPFAARFSHKTYLVRKKFLKLFGDRTVAEFSQKFNLFVSKLSLNFALDQQGLFDRRLGIAAAILLCAIEGKQDSN